MHIPLCFDASIIQINLSLLPSLQMRGYRMERINKSFWNFVKPFQANKSCHTQNDIMLIDNGEVIVEESSLAETINDHYINIVEKSSGQKPCNFASDTQIHWKMTSQILDQLVF